MSKPRGSCSPSRCVLSCEVAALQQGSRGTIIALYSLHGRLLIFFLLYAEYIDFASLWGYTVLYVRFGFSSSQVWHLYLKSDIASIWACSCSMRCRCRLLQTHLSALQPDPCPFFAFALPLLGTGGLFLPDSLWEGNC